MSEFTFDGFEPSNTTPVPDIFFDRLMAFLTDAQLRVFLYIVRRTLGFKKTADFISLKQFRYGIKTGDGRQLDYGCGLKSMKTIVKAARELETMGVIERDKSKAAAGDDNTTRYRIRFRAAAPAPVPVPVGGTSLEEVPGTSPGEVPTSLEPVRYFPSTSTGTSLEPVRVLPPGNPQETVIQETVKQQTDKQESTGGDEHAPPSLASLILPYNDFLFLDDLERPTVLTVVLTSKEDCEKYDTSPTDDRRDFIALDVQQKLAALGFPVNIMRTRQRNAPIVEAAPAPAPKKAARTPKKAALEGKAGIDQATTGEGDQAATKPVNTGKKRTPSRSVEKPDLLAEASEGARFVVGEWLAIFPDPRPVTKYVIENADIIAAYNPEPGEVAACRRWQYANDTNGYYKRRGHDIGDVARDFGKYRSLKNAPASAPQGGSRSGRPPAPAPDQGEPGDQDATAAALAKLQKMRTEKKTTVKPTGPAAAAAAR